MEIRTDLAVESYENGGKTLIDGVKVEENENVTVVSVPVSYTHLDVYKRQVL